MSYGNKKENYKKIILVKINQSKIKLAKIC